MLVELHLVNQFEPKIVIDRIMKYLDEILN